ncbi:MAG: DNA gyrase inhibitor YacG [Casimicrobium sp.]
MKSVACPRCETPVVWGPESKFRPFCSERCKIMDFGAWANEEYRIANATPPDSESALDLFGDKGAQ